MKTEFKKVAFKVSINSIVINILLSLFKFFAGVFSHSGAVISDAVHSASDVLSTIVVMIGVKLSVKESDKEHPYGHERMECVAAIILAVILSITGLGLGYDAVKNIFTNNYTATEMPGSLAFLATILSIVIKEGMYWYTRINAKRINSGALMADAWHHRSDAFSSIGALVGIIGTRLGFLVCDSIASSIICIFIEKAAYDIFKDAVDKMVDKSCDEEFEAQLRQFVLSCEGVDGINMLHTREFGNKIYVDLEIIADGNLTLYKTHGVAESVHNAIEEKFPNIKHIMIHVEPKEN